MSGPTEPVEEPEVEELPNEQESATEEPDDGDPEVSEDDAEEPEEGDEDTEPEFIDVDFGGKTYKVHPDLRDGIMWQADYTRKTQETAELKRALETRITEATEASEGEWKAQAELVAIDAALEQYQNVDWDALERQNPQEAQRHFRNFTMLQQHRGKADNDLTEARKNREAEAQRVSAEQFQQSMADLGRDIPGWGDTKAIELRDFAKAQFGFTDDEFKIGLHDPRQIKMLHMALVASKASKAKPPAQAAPKPASKVKGGTMPAKGLDDRLNTEEWMKRRTAQVRR